MLNVLGQKTLNCLVREKTTFRNIQRKCYVFLLMLSSIFLPDILAEVLDLLTGSVPKEGKDSFHNP